MSYKIAESMQIALIRNVEGDNVSASSATTLLEIGAISGTEITLTGLTAANLIALDALIDKSIDWFIQSLDDYNSTEPSYFGDYTVQDKVTSFDIVGNGKINVVDATGFTVGDRICLYSPWANYSFMPGQKDNGMLYSATAPDWRAHSESSGPSWWDAVNKRYILLFAGYSGTSNYQTGFAYSTDLVTWAVGNSDTPIIVNGDDAHFATHVIPIGNVIDNGDGTVSFALIGANSTGNHIHLGTCDKDDPTTITWSASTLISATDLAVGGIAYYDGVYHLLVSTSGSSIPDRYNQHYTCATIDGTYTKLADMWTTEYNNNDSHWLEGHSTNCMPFVENGKLYAIVGGTQRYTISGIQGNRVFGLMKYDSVTGWSPLNDFEPSLIYPMYFYNIPSEDYGWAGGHTGGYPSFMKIGDRCIIFFAFLYTTDTYQIGVMELNATGLVEANFVSIAQSQRFRSRNALMPAFDNTLNSEADVMNRMYYDYCSIVQKSDTITIQVKTAVGAAAPVITIKKYSGGVLTETDVTMVEAKNYAEFVIYEYDVVYSGYTDGDKLKFIITFGDGTYYTSEPVKVKDKTEVELYKDGYIKLEWSNYESDYGIDYTTNIEHKIWVEGVFENFEPKGVRTVYDNLREKEKLNEIIYRNMVLHIFEVPRYVAEQIQIALGHSTFKVNDIEYVSDDELKVTNHGTANIVTVEVTLTQKEHDRLYW